MSSEEALYQIQRQQMRLESRPSTGKETADALLRLVGAAMIGASPLVAASGNPVVGGIMAVTGAKVLFGKSPGKALAGAAATAATGQVMKNISKNS